MRGYIAAFAVTALSVAAPLSAQDVGPVHDTVPYAADSGLSDMAEQLGDPAKQREIGLMLQTVTEVLLDLPIAPLAQAVAEVAGKDPELVDPGMTVRSVAPEAGAIPEQIGENVPRAMRAMSGLAHGMEAMLPALRDLTERMGEATRAD